MIMLLAPCKDTACHIQRYGSSYTKIRLVLYKDTAHHICKGSVFSKKKHVFSMIKKYLTSFFA